MNTAAIRQQLHRFIDTADDKNINDLFDYIENGRERKYTCTQEELDILHDRAEKFIKGEAVTFTVEEAHNYIKNSRNK
jgi:hypothetical protein